MSKQEVYSEISINNKYSHINNEIINHLPFKNNKKNQIKSIPPFYQEILNSSKDETMFQNENINFEKIN